MKSKSLMMTIAGSILLMVTTIVLAVGCERTNLIPEQTNLPPKQSAYLPEPVFEANPDLVDFYYATWKIASTKVKDQPGLRPAFLFGAALPMALAPFTNVVGDYYEIGSILVSRLARLFDAGFPLERWRSDDLILTASTLLFEGPGRIGDWIGILSGSLIGLVLGFVTYRLGRLVADRLYRRGRSEG